MDFYYMRVSTQQQDLYRPEVEAKELKINSKGVNIVFLKEKLDTKTVLGKAMVLIIGIFAELDIENTKKRQTKGIERAKREGKYKGRKPIDTNTKLIKIPNKRVLFFW